MKLGTLKDGTRDGRLVVVSRDLAHSVPAGPIRTLQQALEDWAAAAPPLEALYGGLNAGTAPGARCASLASLRARRRPGCCRCS
jgi:fumarylacetoacetate (FAA) hydrolase